jgi:DNA-directed RNA polymerase specialized sigma24 family protein
MSARRRGGARALGVMRIVRGSQSAADARFDARVETYRSVIEGYARRLAGGDLDLEEDLVQEGLIALWRHDSRRVLQNERAYITQTIYQAMALFRRTMYPPKREEKTVRVTLKVA